MPPLRVDGEVDDAVARLRGVAATTPALLVYDDVFASDGIFAVLPATSVLPTSARVR